MIKICKKSGKRGFTLIEMLITLAIVMILISYVFATFYIVNSSHAETIVLNDAKDYAELNMKAIKNLTINASNVILSNTSALQAGESGYTSVYIVTNGTTKDSVLYYLKDGSPETKAFDYSQYTAGAGLKKWSINPTFSKVSDSSIHIKLEIIDNASKKTYYILESDLALNNASGSTSITGTSGSVIKVKNPTF